MTKWILRLACVLGVLLGLSPCARANQSFHGWCEDGDQSVITSGLFSTNFVQESFPACTITVYVHGSSALATLYSDNNSPPTPVSNPLTASANGYYAAYAPNGRYDITLTGGGLPSPVTYSDVILNDSSAPGGLLIGSFLVVPYASPAVFSASAATVQQMTLTANVTSSSITNATAGQYMSLEICQNATGGFSFTWPSNVINPPAVTATANTCTLVAMVYDGTNWYAASGSGGSPILAATAVGFGSGTNSLTGDAPNLNFNDTTYALTVSGSVSAPIYYSPESASLPSGISGIDILAGSSATHTLEASYNGGSFGIVPIITGTWTSGDCPEATATVGVLAFNTCGSGGSTTWNTIGNPTGNQALSMGTTTTTWTWGTGAAYEWGWETSGETMFGLTGEAATSTDNYSSPQIQLQGTYWNGATTSNDTWTMDDILEAGTEPESILSFGHGGSSGLVTVRVPNLIDLGLSPNSFVYPNSSNLLTTLTAPTGAGPFSVGWSNTCSGGTTTPVVMQPGMASRTLSTSGAGDAIACTDIGAEVDFSASATANDNVTLPSPSTIGNTNFYFRIVNRNATYAPTIVPGTPYTVNGASSFVIPPGTSALVSIDPTVSNNWSAPPVLISLAASGDLSGSYPDPTVVQIEGAAIPASAHVVGTNSSKQLVASTAHDISVPVECLDTSGSGTVQSCSSVPTFTPTSGDRIRYTTTTANTGTGLTINVNSSGAASVAIPGSSGWTTTLTAGIIPANTWLDLTYTGTNWNVVQTGTVASGGGGGAYVNGFSCSDTSPGCSMGALWDANGILALGVTTVNSAVNYITVADAATGGTPSIAGAGSDSTVGLDVGIKGNANMLALNGNGSMSFNPSSSGNIVANLNLTGVFQIIGGSSASDKLLQLKYGNASPTADAWELLSSTGGVMISIGTGGNPTITAGIAGTSAGAFCENNVTSGQICLEPPTGALGTQVLTLPDATDTLAGIAATQTLTNKSIAASEINSGTLAIANGGTNAATDTAAVSNLLGNPASGTYSIDCTSSSSCTTVSASGGGNTTSSTMTSGYIPQATGANSIGNSSPVLDSGVTTANTLTYAGSGGITASGGPMTATGPSGDAGMLSLVGNTTNQTIPANRFAWGGFTVANATAYGLQPSNTAPSGGQVQVFPTPTSGWSQATWTTLGTLATIATGTLTNGDYCTYSSTGPTISCNSSGGGGGVTSLTGDGNIITNSASTGAVTLSIAGTSGGIPYFSSTSAWKSSALLAANDIVVGGGAGTAPSTDANASLSGAALTLGASGTLGSVTLGGSTSGTLTLEPESGAIGTSAAYFPAGSGTVAETDYTNSWSVVQAFGTNISIGGVTATGATGTGNVVFSASPTFTGTLTTPLTTAGLVTTTSGGVLGSEASATIAQGGTNAATDTAAVSNLLGNPAPGTYSVNCTSSSSCTPVAASSNAWNPWPGGYSTGSVAASANATYCAGMIIPPGGLSVGHIDIDVGTADGTDDSDIGIYNSSGTLEAHIGAQLLSSAGSQTLAFSGGTKSIASGQAYFCMTSAGSILNLNTAGNTYVFFVYGNVSSATTGGALNSTITPPANNFGNSDVPNMFFLP